jgi:hypothetical protein
MSTVFTCPHCGTALTMPPGGLPSGAVCPSCGRPLHGAAVAPGAPPRAAAPVPRGYADDRWDRPEVVPVTPAPLPNSVKTAGIIWIVFGGLILLSFAVQALMQLAFAPPERRGVAIGGTFCGGLLVALFGGGFIFVGVQTLTGTAKDTLGNGIGSIIFAALLGGMAVLLMTLVLGARAAGAPADPVWVGLMVMVIYGLAAAALLAAGVLALVGREGYRAYRRYRRAMGD